MDRAVASRRWLVTVTVLAWGLVVGGPGAPAAAGAARPGEETTGPDGAVYVWVPPGEFDMGSNDAEVEHVAKAFNVERAALAHEQPQHRVRITRGLWLSKLEVTNAQYARFLEATRHEPHPLWDDFRGHGELPVSNVTWDEAVAYARWAEGRLPTEAEWEWAARGPDAKRFPWGAAWSPRKCNSAEYWYRAPIRDLDTWKSWFRSVGANESADGWVVPPAVTIRHLKPAGSFSRNASWCAALDLAGSVWEWCADWYAPDYYGRSPGSDPQGPTQGDRRVVRGGCWNHIPHMCRGATRIAYVPDCRLLTLGFRCVRTP